MKKIRLEGWWASLLVACMGMLVFAAQPFRGLSLWALWQVRATERAEQWIDTGTREALEAAFAAAPQLGSWPGLLVAALFGNDQLLDGLRLLAVVCAGAVLFTVAELGRAWRGPATGVLAAAVLLLTPRFWSAVTVPGPTIFVLASMVLTSASLWALRRSQWWALLALPALVGMLWSGDVGWFWLAPLFVLHFVDFSVGVGRGSVRIRPVTPVELLIIPVGIALAVALHPWWRLDPGDHLGDQMRTWITQPAEPYLWFGERFGPRRMTPWMAALLSLWSLPAGAVFAALFGVLLPSGMGGTRVLRAGAFAMWASSCLLLWSLRTPWHAGIDLVALTLPWLSIGFGAAVTAVAEGMETLYSARRQEVDRRLPAMRIGVMAVWLLACAPGVFKYAWHPEAWHNELLGGARGWVLRGGWRNPHAPVPLSLAQQMVSPNEPTQVAVLVNEWEWRPVLEYYNEAGLLEGELQLTGIDDADWLVLVYEDGLPEFYTMWPEFQRLSTMTTPTWWRSPAGMPLVGVVQAPR
jgi:hypothetical protein